jgi:predicted nucleotidyltransferase component of viral defense system
MSKLTTGHLLRHSPSRGTAGLEAAVIDVAQDFLLSHLANIGALDNLAIKGGTSLRKFYAGNAGRFSTDLDFSIIDPEVSIDAATDLLLSSIEHYENEYFKYGISERRSKPEITYETDFIDRFTLTTKIDINSPIWLSPKRLTWISTPIHKQYGIELPSIQVANLQENMAEKLARVNRKPLARDLYDLVWIARTSPYSQFDRDTVRNLAVLKIWIDQYGMQTNTHHWGNTFGASEYNLSRWNAPIIKDDIADEQIGLLTVPPPKMEDLAKEFHSCFGFLADLSEKEQAVAFVNQSARHAVIETIQGLADSNLSSLSIW